ncbi:MAG: cell division protein [Methyloprofundus sp.]|nr:cell division protein [Methyloprofundus sp.]
MDKDLLRVVILVVGGVVILGMILWGVYKDGPKRNKINFYDDNDPLENIDPSLVVNTDDDDFDIIPISTRDNDDYQVKTRLNTQYIPEEQQSGDDLGQDMDLGQDIEKTTDDISELDGSQLPSLLQLSIIAQAEEGFNGTQLLEACEQVGLVYGSVKVFERLDILSRVDYAVASMAEPGIFPGDDWETYRCPGITFFLQPREVGNAVAVFDEMLNTIGQLSALLKGDVVDQNQQPLTPEALHEIEESLI